MFSYKGIPIQEIVNNKEWQELRESFVGKWKSQKEENIDKLIAYLGDFKDEKKLIRVLNYLTGSAFRLRIIDSLRIRKLKNEVKEKLYE